MRYRIAFFGTLLKEKAAQTMECLNNCRQLVARVDDACQRIEFDFRPISLATKWVEGVALNLTLSLGGSAAWTGRASPGPRQAVHSRVSLTSP